MSSDHQNGNVTDNQTRKEQAKTRTEQAETRSDQAKTRTEQAETKTKQSGTCTEQAETRIEQDKTRTEQARTRTEQAETRKEQARTWTMEQALRASELSYRRLFEAARDGILILDFDTGRIADVNPFLVELLGFSHDEMVGKTVGELSPFKDIESNQAMLERLQKDGYVRYHDLPLQTKDGRKIAVEFVSNVYQAGDRNVLQCNIRDITERKKVETALIRLAAIVESSDDAIMGKDLNGIITNWNKGAKKIFGYTADEMVGSSIMLLIPADRQDEENQILKKIKRGESVEHFETLRKAKDGRLINVSVTSSPIKDATGQVIGVAKVAHDISERKQAEEKAAQEQERLKLIFETVSVGIALATKHPDGTVTRIINDAHLRICGLTREQDQIPGIYLRLRHPDESARQDELYRQLEAGVHAEYSLEKRYVRLDGTVVWVVFSLHRRKFADGRTEELTTVVDITKSKLASEALSAGEERMRLATEATAVGIWEWNIPTNRIRWEAQMFRIYGIAPTPDGFVDYSTWTGAIRPEDLREQEESLQDTLRRRGHGSREFRIQRRSDGECRYIQAVETVRLNAEGQAEWVVGTNLDITGRKQGEAEIRQSEARYRTLFDTLIEGFCTIEMIFDADGKPVDYRFLEINPAFEKQTGLHNAQGRLMRDLAPNHEAHWFEIYGKIALTGEPAQFESDAKALGRHYAVCAYRVGGPESRKVAILFNDVTERKRAEASLQESEERFRTMANSIPQLAWIARADGFIFWYNRRWYEYTGTTPEQMAAWGWQSVHDPEVLPKVMERWTAAINAGKPFDMDFPLRGADGRFRAFLTRMQLLKDSNGLVMQWFGTNTDVEAMKQAEEKIHQLNTELEQRVAERTADLEAANEELEAFSYSVSHDLRAPLRAVNGFAGLVIEEFGPQLPADAQRYLDRIRNGSKQMGLLIDDLLAFSRLSRQPLKRHTVNMAKLVQNVLDDLAPQREGRRIEIQNATLPDCWGDPALLKQVWINLISNAIKYTRGREPAVIEIGSISDNGEDVYSVRDNGTGFNMQYAHKLFGVFQRLHRADEFEGTGVGLAIVQRIVRRHGGRVWAEAEEGRGAIFRFTLKEKRL
jgi:PAS domain S-box-containing protein